MMASWLHVPCLLFEGLSAVFLACWEAFLFSLCISLYISFLCLCCYWCFLLVEFYFIQQRFLLLFTVFWIRKVFPCVFNIVFFKNSFASPIPNEHTLHCITIFFWHSYTQELMPLLSIVVHTCNFSTWEVGAKRSAVQGHPQLYFELEASLY